MVPGSRGNAAGIGRWPARCGNTGSPAGGSVIALETLKNRSLV
jgi:hypothetical protein